MLHPVDYFSDGQYLGHSDIECDFSPHSHAFFCPTCGEVWGRVIVLQSGWQIHIVPCIKHTRSCVSDWSKVPGTITSPFLLPRDLSKMEWALALDYLPPAVVRQEFARLLQYFSQESL